MNEELIDNLIYLSVKTNGDFRAHTLRTAKANLMNEFACLQTLFLGECKIAEELRAEIARLRAQVAEVKAEQDAVDLMFAEGEMFKPEFTRQINELVAENAHLARQVASLERIMEREAEKTIKAGMP